MGRHKVIFGKETATVQGKGCIGGIRGVQSSQTKLLAELGQSEDRNPKGRLLRTLLRRASMETDSLNFARHKTMSCRRTTPSGVSAKLSAGSDVAVLVGFILGRGRTKNHQA